LKNAATLKESYELVKQAEFYTLIEDKVITCPATLQEFEDRLFAICESYYESLIGIANYVGPGKTVKRLVSNEMLVDLLIVAEKGETISVQMDPYSFLKISLEKDGPLGLSDSFIIGIERDRTAMFMLHAQNRIQVQATGQILWAINKNSIDTMQSMVEILRKEPISSMLCIDRFSSDRTLLNWLKSVFPKSDLNRVGRPSKVGSPKEQFVDTPIIPGIFSENKVCFPGLICTLKTFVKVMDIFEIDKSEPIFEALINEYLGNFPSYFRSFVYNTWIKTPSLK